MSRKKRIKITARFKNSLVHSYAGGRLLFSSKNKIFAIDDLEYPKPELVGEIPWKWFQQICHIRFIDRALKASILLVHPMKNEDYLVHSKNKWWKMNQQGLVKCVPLFSDTRPMMRGICESKLGRTYIAEYISNPNRKAIRIFATEDLENFEVAYTFEEGSVRHVHALIVDQELENRIWVLTGDIENECQLYYTDDDFAKIHSFLKAGQHSRATDMIIRNGYLYWGSDSPLEKSFVFRANKKKAHRFEKLMELPGPAYYMAENEAGGLYLGTTVEPGPAVQDKYGRVFGSRPDCQWEEMIRCKSDVFPQYGIFYFPKGTLKENFVVYSQRALVPHEGCMTILRDETWA